MKLILRSCIILLLFSLFASLYAQHPAIPYAIEGNGGVQPYSYSDGDLDIWEGNWMAPQGLYDRGNYVDDPDKWFDTNSNDGSTWNNNIGNYGILLIDLKQIRTINNFRVFQMFSDGKLTGIRIFRNTVFIDDTQPGSSDTGWSEVTSGLTVVDAGSQQNTQIPFYIYDPTEISTADFTSRYIMLHVYNDGSYGDSGYIELKGIKAFYKDGNSYSVNYMRGGPTNAPSVTTQPVINVTSSTATGNGAITSLGTTTVTQYGVCWTTSATSYPTTSSGGVSTEGTASVTGSFISTISGFVQNTTYYVRAYATNSSGTTYGGVYSFNSSTPTVSTSPVTNIGTTTARCNGDVTDLGATAVTQHGFCWGTSPEPSLLDDFNELNEKSSTGTFFADISGLTSNTFYYVRAYATNGNGTTYGDQVSFTTNDNSLPVELSSFSAGLTSDYLAELSWTTKSQTDLLGFNILRNYNRDSETAEQINNSVIVGENSSYEINYTYVDVDVDTGTGYYYWLECVNLDGTVCLFGPVSITIDEDNGDDKDVPDLMGIGGIHSIYPNPFNPKTGILYSIPTDSEVFIDVYNSKGQLVKTFSQGYQEADKSHTAYWTGIDSNSKDVGSGVYLFRLRSQNFMETKKAVLIK